MNKKLLFAGSLALSLSVLACNENGGGTNLPVEATVLTTTEQINGQQLFVQNCAACHQKDQSAVGPALRGVLARWDNNKERLYSYIRNNIEVTKSGDPRALQLQQDWSGAMPLYDGFSDKQLEAILAWIEI